MAYVRAELVESVDDLIRGGGLEVVKKAVFGGDVN